jgi:pyridoxamine 5'-phosphate oxidase
MPRSDHPLDRFRQWYRQAERAGIPQPEAMALATSDARGRPTLRWVLLKEANEEGFVFFTDKRSRKGQALEANPWVAATFFWQPLGKSVRIEGRIRHIADPSADAYWQSRPRGSQLSAAVSRQSAALDARVTLVRRRRALEASLGGGPVPRPPEWGGYVIVPDRIEFWGHREDRLHHREVYTRSGRSWKKRLLQP